MIRSSTGGSHRPYAPIEPDRLFLCDDHFAEPPFGPKPDMSGADLEDGEEHAGHAGHHG